MSALPCYADLADRRHATERGNQVSQEERINERASQLATEMWQDLEYLTDALGDAVGTVADYRKDRSNHPQAVLALALLRDGSDDVEFVRILRSAARSYIDNTAHDRAEEEAADDTERAAQDRVEARWEGAA